MKTYNLAKWWSLSWKYPPRANEPASWLLICNRFKTFLSLGVSHFWPSFALDQLALLQKHGLFMYIFQILGNIWMILCRPINLSAEGSNLNFRSCSKQSVSDFSRPQRLCIKRHVCDAPLPSELLLRIQAARFLHHRISRHLVGFHCSQQ